MLKSTVPIPVFFWQNVQQTDFCWNWMGLKNNMNYGQFRRSGTSYLAHRWSYEQWHGLIPSGLEIDHLCKNTLCVNPAHLEAVIPRVNKLRSSSPWANNARKTECKHGHQFSEENTAIDQAGSRQCRACKRRRCKAWRDKRKTHA